MRLLALALGLSALLQTPFPGIRLSHVRSGEARLRLPHPPNVVLDLKTPPGKTYLVPLTYAETGQQRRGFLWQASLLAESPGHFLIFTDRFTSNANIQGQCGASPDGERFLHIVSLAPAPKETLSVNLDSCWRSVSALKTYPRYDPKSLTLIVALQNLDTSSTEFTTYTLATDGTVQAQQPNVSLSPLASQSPALFHPSAHPVLP